MRYLIILLVSSVALGQVVRPPATNPSSPVTLGQLQTTAPVSLYVETTGNDTNSCTSVLMPCLTIQGAIDKLPKRVKHPVTIAVGAGSFDGAVLTGVTFEFPASTAAPPGGLGGAYFYLKGTFVAPTLTTGTTSGTATSGTAGTSSTATFGTLTDTSQAWTPNELVGLLVERTTGTGSTTSILPNRYVIVANTSDTLTIAGTWTAPNATSTYAIRDWATTINPSVVFPPVASSTSVSSARLGFVVWANQQAVTFNIVAAGIRFQLDNALEYGIYVHGLQPFQSANNLFEVIGGASNPVGITGQSPIIATRNVFLGNTTSTGGTAVNIIPQTATNAQLVGNYIQGFQTQLSVGSAATPLTITGNQFLNPYSGALNIAGFVSGTSITGNRIDGTGCTNACIRLNSYSFGNQMTGAAYVSGLEISNCPWGLFIQGVSPIVLWDTISGSGNGIAIQALFGPSIWIHPNVAPTGTTADLDVDTKQMTWAQFRSLSPVRVGSDYGTVVFQ